jgi:hypothetical protein
MRGRSLSVRKVDVLSAVTRGTPASLRALAAAEDKTSLGVESREPEPMQYRPWPADPGSVANLYSVGSSQHRPGVVARCCRPLLRFILAPYAGTDMLRILGDALHCCCS